MIRPQPIPSSSTPSLTAPSLQGAQRRGNPCPTPPSLRGAAGAAAIQSAATRHSIIPARNGLRRPLRQCSVIEHPVIARSAATRQSTVPTQHRHFTATPTTIQVPNRAQAQEALKAAGIPTAVHHPAPLNRQPAVADPSATLPIGDAIAEHVMSLPMHPWLNADTQKRFIAAVAPLKLQA